MFLKSRLLVELVSSLGEYPSAAEAIEALVPANQREELRAGARPPGRIRGDRCPLTSAPLPLKDQFTRGLDAPICLTWELTYACNLACVHCLSSSGRRDPAELTPGRGPAHRRRAGRHEGLLREHRRRRADAAPRLLRPGRLRRRAPGRGQVLHQRDPAHARPGPASWPPSTTSTCRSASTAPPRPDQRRRAGRGLLRRRPPGHGQPGGGRLRAVQDQRGRDPAERDGARRVGRHRRGLRRPAAADPPAALGPGRRHLGHAAPDGGAAAHALPLAARAPRRADRRLLLPPLRPGRAARRAEPVRGGAGGLPDRPGRRRLRLPLRHRPPSSWPATSATRAASRSSGGSPRCSLRCASPRAPGPAPRAARSTPAGAAAWRPSSSPGLPLDGPDPECVHGHGEAALAALDRRPHGGARPLQGATATGCRCRCPRRSASGRHRRRRAEPWTSAGATWPQVEAAGGGHACWPCRWARSSSTVRTSLSTPTPASPWRWPTGWLGAPSGRGRRPGARLRGQRRARRLPRHTARSATTCWRTSSSSWCARPADAFAGVVLVSAHGGNARGARRRRGAVPARRRRRARVAAGGRRGRRPRRAHGDVAHAGHRPWRRPAGPGRGRVHRAPRRPCCPVCAPRGCGRYRPTACWATPQVRAPTRAGSSSTPW